MTLRASYAGVTSLALLGNNMVASAADENKQEPNIKTAEAIELFVCCCRKPFGLVLHRYFRMRFCSPDCLKAYQQRLDTLTRTKIERLNLSRAFSDGKSEAA